MEVEVTRWEFRILNIELTAGRSELTRILIELISDDVDALSVIELTLAAALINWTSSSRTLEEL